MPAQRNLYNQEDALRERKEIRGFQLVGREGLALVGYDLVTIVTMDSINALDALEEICH